MNREVQLKYGRYKRITTNVDYIYEDALKVLDGNSPKEMGRLK